jgi:hypothetical protein
MNWKMRAIAGGCIRSALTMCLLSAMPARANDSAEIDLLVATAGEVLAVDDLCQWDMAPRIEALLQAGAAKLKMPPPLQRELRAKIVEVRNSRFGGLSVSGRARTKTEICTPEERAFLEKLVGGLSFD